MKKNSKTPKRDSKQGRNSKLQVTVNKLCFFFLQTLKASQVRYFYGSSQDFGIVVRARGTKKAVGIKFGFVHINGDRS